MQKKNGCFYRETDKLYRRSGKFQMELFTIITCNLGKILTKKSVFEIKWNCNPGGLVIMKE